MAAKLAELFGNTCNAAFLTPDDGCFNASTATPNASAFYPSNNPKPCKVHKA